VVWVRWSPWEGINPGSGCLGRIGPPCPVCGRAPWACRSPGPDPSPRPGRSQSGGAQALDAAWARSNDRSSSTARSHRRPGGELCRRPGALHGGTIGGPVQARWAAWAPVPRGAVGPWPSGAVLRPGPLPVGPAGARRPGAPTRRCPPRWAAARSVLMSRRNAERPFFL
jgi:hypothetical protein